FLDVLIGRHHVLDVFFFQAEAGIRDGHVTGVQTCALPIFEPCVWRIPRGQRISTRSTVVRSPRPKCTTRLDWARYPPAGFTCRTITVFPTQSRTTAPIASRLLVVPVSRNSTQFRRGRRFTK